MQTLQIELDADLAAALQQLNQPFERSARALIVLELYRRGVISSGKAAQLLGMERFAFVQCSSSLGIPYFDLTPEEFADDMERLRNA